MEKNSIIKTNDILLAQLQRLENVEENKLEAEMQRAKAIERVAKQIINNNKLALNVAKAFTKGDIVRATTFPQLEKPKQDE